MLFVLNPDFIENDPFTMYANGELDLSFHINCNVEIESHNILCRGGYQAEICIINAENAEKSSNHEFWRKMFCLVGDHIYFPKSGELQAKPKFSPDGRG